MLIKTEVIGQLSHHVGLHTSLAVSLAGKHALRGFGVRCGEGNQEAGGVGRVM